MPEMQPHWYPGHMAKTKRLLNESLSLVDAVIELLDARIPRSSQNPDINDLCRNKPRLVLLNKSDMSDKSSNLDWRRHIQSQGYVCLFTDSLTGKGINAIPGALNELLAEKIERNAEKGMNRAVKAMIVGIPNVGKSSLINRMSGGKKVRVEDRPGVTRQNQWIRPGNGIELLDTPGVLWPRFDDPVTGLYLAFTGAIKDSIMDIQELSSELLAVLSVSFAKELNEKYKINVETNLGVELLAAVAKKRGMILRGGEPDLERAAVMVIDDFRGAKIGKITLERP